LPQRTPGSAPPSSDVELAATSVNGRTRYHTSQLGVKKFLHGFTLECRTGRQFVPNFLGYITNCDLNAHACIMTALQAACKLAFESLDRDVPDARPANTEDARRKVDDVFPPTRNCRQCLAVTGRLWTRLGSESNRLSKCLFMAQFAWLRAADTRFGTRFHHGCLRMSDQPIRKGQSRPRSQSPTMRASRTTR